MDGILYFFSSDKLWYSYGMFVFTIFLVAYLIIRDIGTVPYVKTETQYGADNNTYSGKKIRIQTTWLIWGVIASVGTLAIGETISALIRPAFLLRYLYPAASIMFAVLAVGVSEFKRKRAVAAVVAIISLIVFVPNYLTVFNEEKINNQKCEETQKTMQQLLTENDTILTDSSHYDWTVLDYYFPGIAHRLISNGYDNFDKDENYWLFWTGILTEKDRAWLKNEGYTSEKVYVGALADFPVGIYKLTTDTREPDL